MTKVALCRILILEALVSPSGLAIAFFLLLDHPIVRASFEKLENDCHPTHFWKFLVPRFTFSLSRESENCGLRNFSCLVKTTLYFLKFRAKEPSMDYGKSSMDYRGFRVFPGLVPLLTPETYYFCTANAPQMHRKCTANSLESI